MALDRVKLKKVAKLDFGKHEVSIRYAGKSVSMRSPSTPAGLEQVIDTLIDELLPLVQDVVTEASY